MISLDPIAYFIASAFEKADVPKQGVLSKSNEGIIRFRKGYNYEQALQDLLGMERIWILFWMHEVHNWKTKVQPPRPVSKKGVFATRSPHRPNPIGLSCVRLISISGLDLLVEGHDLIDGTPILDIKPYLEYADSFPGAASGWMEESKDVQDNEVFFSLLALKEMAYICEHKGPSLREKIESRLRFFTDISSSNRTKHIKDGFYLQAYKSWRYLFKKNEEGVCVLLILSGYGKEDLEGLKDSRWEDVPLHRSFLKHFEIENAETLLNFSLSLV